MRESLRKSGIDIIGDVPWGTHFCQFYQTKEDLMDILVPYFKAGLENNEFCLWIISQPLVVEAAKEALRKAIPDLDTYLEKGQITIIPHTCWYLKEDILDSERALSDLVEELYHVLDSGYEGLRFGGDIFWTGNESWNQENWNRFVGYEKQIGNVVDNYQTIALYTYPLSKCSATEIIDVVSNHQFALVKKDGEWKRTENSGYKKITECERTGKVLRQREQHVTFNLRKIPAPAREMANFELAEIIDIQAFQSLMEDFYKLTYIPIGLNDKGNVLISVGWQDICTKFHRLHPETCKHCVESNTKLSEGVPLGEFKLYRCKNNMWDAVTPITVNDQHVGNIFAGQFFFDDEPLDYELFRSLARKYGFNEEEYIAALEKVPRLSRQAVDKGLSFLAKFANLLSQLSYSNIILAQSLAERDSLLDTLRESEERFRSVLENSFDSAYRRDLQNNCFDYMSPVIEQITGFSAKEIAAMTRDDLLDLIHPDDRPVVIAGIAQSLDEGFGAYEYRFKCKDGKYRWLADHFSLIKDKTGMIHFKAGIARDITERKRAEEEVQGSRNMLQLIMDNIPQGIFWKDRNSRYIGCNKVFAKAAGLESPENIVGKTDYDLPWSPEQTESFREYDRRIMENETPDYHIAEQQQEADGELAWIETNKIPMHDAKGNVIGILGTYEDITERKQAEEALRFSNLYNRSLIEASLDPLITIGHDGKITDVNSATEHVTGYSRNDLIGTDFSDYFTEPEKARTGYQQVFIDGEVRDYPLDIRHKDGHTTPVLYNASVYRDENGEVIGVLAAARDITESKKAEKALQVSEERYRSLYENSLDGIFLTKPDGTILSANPQACLMFGMTEDEIIRARREGIVVNDEKLAAALEERERTGRLRAELTHRRKDGLTFICDTTSRTFVDTDGSISTSLIIRDITERKRAEEALRASEERFRKIVETAKEGIWLIDSYERTIFVNQMMSEMLGYSIEEIMGQSPRKFMSPEFREKVDDRLREHMQGFSQVVDYRLIRKDGSDLWCIVSSSPLFDDQGKYTGTLAMITDITERKKAEEALRLSNIYNRSLIEASLDPLVTIGPGGKITDVNGATEQVTGHSRNDLIGTDFSDYFTEPEKARTGYQQVFAAGEVRDYPLEIQHKDGHTTPVLYNASVYRDANGEVIGVFAAARDITERKKAEEALKKAHDNLEKLVKERTNQLEKAYNSLKESKEGLSEAQKIAHIGNWEWEIATGKTYWSDELYRIFGLNPQESTPTSDEFFNYIHPEDREYVVNAIKAALKGKPYGGIDYRIILDNGEERIVNAKSEVIFDEENIPIRVKGTIQDITGRKKTEEKIQILANAVESSNDAIVTESLDGIITSWNKAAEQIYGYSAEEILGKNVSILEPDNVKGEIKSFSEMIKQGKKVQHYETLRLRKDGKIISISVTLSPIFNSSGELVALSAIVRDITERKREEKALRESEARLRRFYESGMFGVVYYNLDGSITEANDKFLEIVGYTREDLQAGQIKWNKMTPPEYSLLDEKCIAELKANCVYAPYEKEYIRKDGSHVPIILGAATFDPECHEGIAFVLDNTERKKTEIALAEMDRIRIKEIHHRIKNNLQVISSLLDLQSEKFQDKEVLEAFRESQNRVISMSLIHEELYKGKGSDTLDFSTYLRELAKNLLQTYSLSSKNINLLMDLEENAFFDMDTAVPLGIIVNELVSNSLKHAFDAGEEGEVRIRLCREEKKKEISESHFSLTISDNGKGIPEDIELGSLESLGLQLVSTLVDQLEGEIEIKREQGTEFRITFNVAEKS